MQDNCLRWLKVELYNLEGKNVITQNNFQCNDNSTYKKEKYSRSIWQKKFLKWD